MVKPFGGLTLKVKCALVVVLIEGAFVIIHTFQKDYRRLTFVAPVFLFTAWVTHMEWEKERKADEEK